MTQVWENSAVVQLIFLPDRKYCRVLLSGLYGIVIVQDSVSVGPVYHLCDT